MKTFAVKCISNPCGKAEGRYLVGNTWYRTYAKVGVGDDINQAHANFEFNQTQHTKNHCGCLFEVVEVESE